MSNQNSSFGNDAYQLLQDYLQKRAQNEKNEFIVEQAYTFLLLLWNHFTLYSDDDEGGNGSIAVQKEVTHIKEKDTYLIFDHGNYLTTSVGAYYGSYSTQRLINSVRKMIEQMAKRGVKKVKFLGTPVALRVAQEECEKYNIKINFGKNTSTDLNKMAPRHT